MNSRNNDIKKGEPVDNSPFKSKTQYKYKICDNPKIEYNHELVKKFNNFFKIKHVKKPSKTGLLRYEFFVKELVNNRFITIKGYQLCSTALARKHGVHHTTISKWLKQLVSLNILKIRSKKWKKGAFSKSYILSVDAKDIINEFNGFAKKYKKAWHKYNDRKRKLKEFNTYLYEFKDAVRLASGWLGCPKQFVKAIKKHIPSEVLEAPREGNVRQQKIHDFLKAYNYIAKNHGYPKVKTEDWYDYVGEKFDYFGFRGSYSHGDVLGPSAIKDQLINYRRSLEENEMYLKFKQFKRYNVMIRQLKDTWKYYLKGNTFEFNFVPMGAIS